MSRYGYLGRGRRKWQKKAERVEADMQLYERGERTDADEQRRANRAFLRSRDESNAIDFDDDELPDWAP